MASIEPIYQLVIEPVSQPVIEPIIEPIIMRKYDYFLNSYSLNIIVKWLEKKDPLPIFHFNSSTEMCNTGLALKLNNKLQLSIQTDPNITGYAFAETAILYKKVLYDTSLGYDDVKQFYTPEELFEHLNYLFEEMKLRGPNYYSKNDTKDDTKYNTIYNTIDNT
jgi:hypothetical protein